VLYTPSSKQKSSVEKGRMYGFLNITQTLSYSELKSKEPKPRRQAKPAAGRRRSPPQAMLAAGDARRRRGFPWTS
jgi:hypothetical protein